MKTKKTFCDYYFYTDYYETECGNQIDEENFNNLQPIYCPFCGGEIKNT